MAWLFGWEYSKSITLSRASGTVTNYQMKILVGESAGSGTNDVHCAGHCLSTFNDLRFTNAFGTILDYWIESISGTSPTQVATVWVEFDSIGTGATTFYMYYGNSTAAAYSNGANTFIVFDNFERGVDGDTVGGIWTETTAHCHISTEQKFGGTRSLKLVGGAAAPLCYTSTSPTSNIAYKYRVYKEDAALSYLVIGNGTWLLDAAFLATEVVQIFDGSAWNNVSTITKDAWNEIDLRNFNWTNGTLDLYVNGLLAKSSADFSWGSALYANQLLLQGVATSNYDTWIDDFIIRNYRTTEPAFGAWGAESSLQFKMNISGSWKIFNIVQLDVSGVWKTINTIQINVGGAWKDIVVG